jgi:dehydrogenase/reductase SDR family protein 12
MVTLSETFEAVCRPEVAFDYLAGFESIRFWDPSVLEARRLSPRPPSVGSAFELRLRFAGQKVSMRYRITALEPPRRIELEGRGQHFRATDRITLEASPGGTRIRYEVDVDLDAPVWKTLECVLMPALTRTCRESARRLAAILSGKGTYLRPSLMTRMADQALLPGVIGFTRLGSGALRRRRPLPQHSLAGRTVAITGATSGIGLAAAGQLHRIGADLILIGRDPTKTGRVREFLLAGGGGPNVWMETADLSLMGDIRDLADRLTDRFPAIHVLINNAGALFNRWEQTCEGIEKTLATNLLGPYRLTSLLAPKLAASREGRVVNVSSGGMYTQKIAPEDLQSRNAAYDGTRAYARAKRGLVILTEKWAGDLIRHGVSVHAMHPGWVDTPGLRASLPAFHRLIRRLLRTPDEGADTITWLAASGKAGLTTGLFWLDRKPRSTHIFPWTRETPRERRTFFSALDRLARNGNAPDT